MGSAKSPTHLALVGVAFLRRAFLGVSILLPVLEVSGANSFPFASERVTAPAFGHAGARSVGRSASAEIVVAQARETETKKPAERKRVKGKQKKAAVAAVGNRGIDTGDVWRGETEVFTADQLVKLEPILNVSTCRNEKGGCTYQDNGKPGSEESFAFRLIPWKVSPHRSYLVRNDRCGAGGCDQGLFVLIDGRWRLVTEAFGILERASSKTLGFNDLRFQPRGQAPVRLVWDGRAYREAPIN